MVRLLAGLGVVGAVLGGCSLVESRNSDPRAYGGSASGVTLEKALDDNGIELPEDASGVRFAVQIGPNENFDLTFDTECGTVPEFLEESSFKESPESYVLLPSLVETAGQEHDWKLASYPEARGIEDDRLRSVDRSVIVAKAGGTSCKVLSRHSGESELTVIRFDQLPSILVEWFPSAEEPVRALLRERQGEGAVLTFGMISECFWWDIFEPALRGHDVPVIKRCLQITESLLDEGDQVVQDALAAGVLDYLFDPSWQETVHRYSGPGVRRILSAPKSS